jgi:hypothetical protein
MDRRSLLKGIVAVPVAAALPVLLAQTATAIQSVFVSNPGYGYYFHGIKVIDFGDIVYSFSNVCVDDLSGLKLTKGDAL